MKIAKRDIKPEVLDEIGRTRKSVSEGLFGLDRIFKKESDSGGMNFVSGDEDIQFTIHGFEIDIRWNHRALSITSYKDGKEVETPDRVKKYLHNKLVKEIA